MCSTINPRVTPIRRHSEAATIKRPSSVQGFEFREKASPVRTDNSGSLDFDFEIMAINADNAKLSPDHHRAFRE
jgi:hypothetical protein